MRSDRLGKLLRPRAIAVVGAPEKLGNGATPFRIFSKSAIRAASIRHSRYESVLGLACYPR